MIAILGSSGSGKTTLLDILANRVKSGKVSGKIHFNGSIIKNKKSFQNLNGYVYQNDVLKATLNVRETIDFYSKFQLDVNDEMKNERINNLIEELGLKNIENSLIGNEKQRGISGGEKKRVSIAIQLIRDPESNNQKNFDFFFDFFFISSIFG